MTELDLNDLGPHTQWLRRLAGSLVREGADDAAQEVWLAVLRHRESAAAGGRAWLTTVLRNVLRHGWRGGQRRQTRERVFGDAQAETAPSPEELLDRHQQHTLLAQAVGELDEPFRSTVLLRYVEGLSPAEIAHKAGVPGGTVRWRLKRANELLRARMDERNGGRRSWALAFVPLGGIAMKTTTKVAAAAGLILLLGGGLVALRDPVEAPRGEAQRAAVLAGGSAESRPGERLPAPAPSADRPGVRTRIPRFVVPPTANAPDAGHPPRRLAQGKGTGPTDRRPNPPASAAELKQKLTERLEEARSHTEKCLARWAETDPSLEAGVMLVFQIGRDGLEEVWLEGRQDVPSGPLQCLGEGVYRVDWSGLTEEPVEISDRFRYQPEGDANGPNNAAR